MERDSSQTIHRKAQLAGWFTSHILGGTLDGGIPLAYEKYYYRKDSVPFYFDFQEGVSGPYLRHPQQIFADHIPDFQDFVMSDIISQYLQKGGNKTSK